MNFVENRVTPLCRRLEAEENATTIPALLAVNRSENQKSKIKNSAVGWFDLEALPIMQEALRKRLTSAKVGFDMGKPGAFASTLSNYLMTSSVKIIHELGRSGVESHILSASADLFVKGASQSLGIPASRLHGIEVRTRDGRLTEELVYPLTWNVGKLGRLKQIVSEIEHQPGGKRVFVLAGFGDSYSTDGPFLKFIATQSLPAGKPIAVFYDGSPEPPDYRGLFYHARHDATVGGK
ncbi:MAG TPA: hypothetical protein VN578_05715 [Candidatus Binatia bacterium]|nr:hypothetical protein [Candidatus Binatia bacterium]